MERKIHVVDDPEQAKSLRKRSRPIPIDNVKLSETQSIIQELLEVSSEIGGLGLAAPQIGHPVRIFVMEPQKPGENPVVVINPELMASRGRAWSYAEGCLSVPNNRRDVKRAKEVVIQYVDELGNAKRMKSRNKIEAFIIQHEMDHLNGILICDK